MKKLPRGLMQVMLMVSVCSSSLGATYYVSASGNDSNPGTIESPKQTISEVNSLKLSAGDTVLFNGGDTFAGTLSLSRESGTSGNLITIGSYGTGRASINAGSGMGFSSGGSSYVKLQDLIFYGDGRETGNTSDGVVFSGGDHVWIEDVDISGFQHAGLQFDDVDDFSALRVECHENGYCGIEIVGSWNNPNSWAVGGYIGYCKTYNNPGDPTILDNHSGNGIMLSSVKDVVVEYCESYDNGWDMPRSGNGPVGIWTWSVDNVLIQYCISHNNKTSPNGLDGGGFDFDGGTRNSTIQYCLSYDNEGAGYGMLQFNGALDWFNNTIRYNVSYNDGTKNAHAGIALWNGAGAGTMYDFYAYNNTIYNDFGYAVEYFQNPVVYNANFANNIFIYKIAPVAGWWRDDSYTFNHYWDVDGEFSSGGYTSFTDWINSHTKERHDSTVVATWGDPILSTQDVTPTLTDPSQLLTYNDFTPSFYSPVVDSGADLNSIYGWNVGTHDLGETSIPANGSFDRGAQELFQDGSNQAPYITVGADQIIQLPTDQVALSGTAIDDGLPAGSTLSHTWTQVSGSGSVTFANATDLNTTATFSEPDTYVLRLTADDGELSISNDVQITLLDEPVPGAAVVAVNCGGGAYTATDGTAYSADTNFSGGGTYYSGTAIAGTEDDALYQSERFGNLSYSFPVANGEYEVTLKMAEIYSPTPVGGRVFDVSIEGTQVLDNFDILAAAGTNYFTACDRTFFTTVSDSMLTIQLTGVQGNAQMNAILVVNGSGTNNTAPTVNAGDDQTIQLPTDQVTLAGTVLDDNRPEGAAVTNVWSKVSGPGSVTFGNATNVNTTATFSQAGTYVLRLTASDTELSASDTVQITLLEESGTVVAAINCGGGAYTATDGTAYVADVNYSGGSTYSTGNAITGTEDDTLYQTERYNSGDLTYSIPVANGDYQVTLKMAEIYKTGVGQRLLDVSIEGTQVIDDLDLIAVAGHDVAYDQTFSTTVSDDVLTIQITGVVDTAQMNAILVAESVTKTAYDTWADQFGGVDVIGSATNDYDLDGISNFAEYALNGNPTNANASELVTFNVSGTTVSFVFSSNSVDDSLTYRLIDRTNLVTGTAHTNQWDSQSFGPVNGDYVTVSNQYGITTDARFIWLEVE